MAMTFTYDRLGPIKRVIADWTSNSGGAASGTTALKVSGYLLKATTDPSATAPTDNYDITITDEEGVDVLGKCGDDLQDRSTSATQTVHFVLNNYDTTPVGVGAFPAVCDLLTFTVANAGDTKSGQIILYIDGAIQGEE